MIWKSTRVALSVLILALAGPVAAGVKVPRASNPALKAALTGLDACYLSQTSIDPNRTRLSRAMVKRAGFSEQKRNPYLITWVWPVPGRNDGREALVVSNLGQHYGCGVKMGEAAFTPDSVKAMVTTWANGKGLEPFATKRPDSQNSLTWTLRLAQSGDYTRIVMVEMYQLVSGEMLVSIRAFYVSDDE